MITGDPRRRRIASILIVLGNAGIVTMIATAASALNPDQVLIARLSESILPVSIPSTMIPWVNLTVIVLGLLVIYMISTNRKIAGKFTLYLRKRIRKKDLLKPVSFEELLFLTGGYGISKIAVCENSPLIDKTLLESDLRKQDITVLAIVRGSETMPNPTALVTIHKGDDLIVFGNLHNIRSKVCNA